MVNLKVISVKYNNKIYINKTASTAQTHHSCHTTLMNTPLDHFEFSKLKSETDTEIEAESEP
jgi:hypothetical protein